MNKHRSIIIRICAFIMLISGFGLLYLNTYHKSFNLLELATPIVILLNGIFFITYKQDKSKHKLSPIQIILLVLMGIFVGMIPFKTYQGLTGNNQKEKLNIIKEISYDADCSIKLRSNKGLITLGFNNPEVAKRECVNSPKPIISIDGNYAAFEIRMLIKDKNMKSGLSTYNATYVYLSDKNTWVTAYSYGAAEAKEIKFNSNNDLTIDLWYNGSLTETKVVNKIEYAQILIDEQQTANQRIESLPEIKKWQSMINQKNKIAANKSEAIIKLDSFKDTYIMFHVYEFVPIDGHSATFNWYRYNRLTGDITREF